MELKPVNMIVAWDKSRIIGHGMDMPGWHTTDDYKLNFVPKTKDDAIILVVTPLEDFLVH